MEGQLVCDGTNLVRRAHKKIMLWSFFGGWGLYAPKGMFQCDFQCSWKQKTRLPNIDGACPTPTGSLLYPPLQTLGINRHIL